MLNVFRLPGVDDRREEMTGMFLAAVSLALAVSIWPANNWVSLFAILAVFSQYHPDYTRQSFLAFHNIFFGLVWFFVLCSLFDSKSSLFLIDAMCLIAIVHVCYLALQCSNLDPVIKGRFSPDDPLVGITANKNEASALIAYCFAGFLRPVWRCFIPVMIYGLILTTSTGGPVAIAIGLTVYGFVVGSWWAWIGPASAVGVGAYLLFVDTPYLRRFEVVSIVLKHFYPQHPWTGSGLGHWKNVFKVLKLLPDKSQFYYYRFAHNEYLHMLFEMGIGFAVVCAGYIQHSIRIFNRRAIIPATALVIIAVNSFYHFGFHVGATAMIGVTWMAVYNIQTKEIKCQKTQ